MLVEIPISAYQIFIAPQLSAVGYHFSDPLLKANDLIINYWWLLLAPTLLACALLCTKILLPIWPGICQALTANNSFKPKPLRGSA
jgi:hypothetical protein